MQKYQYILAPFIGWIVAQSIKFVLVLRKDGIELKDAIQSGGMPSSHSAFMAAITTVIGLGIGIESALFGLSLAITAIVLYDATGVRRTTGEQTKVIESIAKANKNRIPYIHNAKGHSVEEVVVGVVVGIAVGGIMHVLIY